MCVPEIQGGEGLQGDDAVRDGPDAVVIQVQGLQGDQVADLRGDVGQSVL